MSQPSSYGRTTVVAVVNPRSRTTTAAALDLLNRFVPDDVDLIVRSIDPGVPLSALVSEDLRHAHMVVAVGGDGTVSSVASVILESGIPLGIIPTGTTNMVAKVAGIPLDPGKAAELLFADHTVQDIDVGRVGDRVLLHMGGAGLDARVFLYTDPRLKRMAGWIGYSAGGLRGLREPASDVVLTVDGERIEAKSRLVLIANSAALVSPRFRLADGVHTNDGLFDVVLFTADTLPDMMKTAGRMVLGRLTDSPHARRYAGRVIRLEADPPLPVELDGEVTGTTPIHLTVEQQALRLVVPIASR